MASHFCEKHALKSDSSLPADQLTMKPSSLPADQLTMTMATTAALALNDKKPSSSFRHARGGLNRRVILANVLHVVRVRTGSDHNKSVRERENCTTARAKLCCNFLRAWAVEAPRAAPLPVVVVAHVAARAVIPIR